MFKVSNLHRNHRHQQENAGIESKTHQILILLGSGPDDPNWVIALCPNCHRRAHYGQDSADYNQRLTQSVNKMEDIKVNKRSKSDPNRENICYLCGQNIAIEDNDKDHVPPEQFYAPELRTRINFDNLTTLNAHKTCNKSYGRDEEYVVAALAPVAMGSLTADAVVKHQTKQFRSGEKPGLAKKIIQSFDKRPSGLILPNDRILIRVEGERIKRIVWKMVRGLYFIEYGNILTESTEYFVEIREPKNKAPSSNEDIWQIVKAEPSKGNYQGVFAYKNYRYTVDNICLYLWGMLWWDRIMIFVAHNDPMPQIVQGNEGKLV